uniref:Uncharacterized protein n=1 Tax=Anguilla anguilla TaxID=7936 RepID=A0A0E9XLQ1_ANGAN
MQALVPHSGFILHKRNLWCAPKQESGEKGKMGEGSMHAVVGSQNYTKEGNSSE